MEIVLVPDVGAPGLVLSIQRRLRFSLTESNSGIGYLARILREAFYGDRRKHGIFGSIVEIRTEMYFCVIFRTAVWTFSSTLRLRFGEFLLT